MCENYLRINFDFGEYLARCVSDSLASIYSFTWFSYCIVMIGIALWRIVVFLGNTALYLTFALFPFLLILSLACVIYKLQAVYYALIPDSRDPEDFNFPLDPDPVTIDPLWSVKNLKQPPYLAGKVESKDHENALIKICCALWHPYELSYAKIFEGRYPNRHEVLFWFDSAGPKFIICLIQAAAILLVLWTVVVILYYIGFFADEVDLYAIIIIALSFVLILFVLLSQIPLAVRLLSIVSNIGMMKNKPILYATLTSAKEKRAENNLRMYRQIKLFRREIVKKKHPGEEKRAKADLHIQKLASEAYQLYVDGDANHISLDRLEEVLHQCGSTLKEDEMRVFANECVDKKTKRIYLAEFLEAVESFQHDVAMQPQFVVESVLRDYFREKFPRNLNVQSVKLNDITKFFD